MRRPRRARWGAASLVAALIAGIAIAAAANGPRARRPATPPPVVNAVGAAATNPAAAAEQRSRAAGRRAHAPAQHRARTTSCAAPPRERPITRRRWLSGVTITEYYPAPERWFVGRRVATPGLAGVHRVDWLYSARGVSMEGDGVDVAGHRAHISQLGSAGWVNAAGRSTTPGLCATHWSRGAPAWRAGGWRNRAGAVTFPLAYGGWSNGVGHEVGGYGGATFAPGPSMPLRYYRSVAVDPRLIPRASRIYVPAYRALNGGWFVAQDTGGAIIGRHLDVYRPPPARSGDLGRLFSAQRVYVVPPGA